MNWRGCIKVVGTYFSGIGKLREWVRRRIYARRYGLDVYDAIYGHELRGFLDREYGQQDWSWQLKLLGVNREHFVFEVRYDDCGAWAGVVAVAPHRPLDQRFHIVRKEERKWPPSGWAD